MKKFFSVALAVMTAFVLAVPAFAYDFGDTVPWFEGVLPDYTEEMEQYRNEGYVYVTLMTDSEERQHSFLQTTKPLKQNSVNDYIVATESCSYVNYVLSGSGSNMSWVSNGYGTISAGQTLSSTYTKVLWSNYNLYDTQNNLVSKGDDGFFPVPPLAELILEVTEEEMVAVTIPEMVGAMKVLVPCGVGLMALLVGLKLFGKRSLLFLR